MLINGKKQACVKINKINIGGLFVCFVVVCVWMFWWLKKYLEINL